MEKHRPSPADKRFTPEQIDYQVEILSKIYDPNWGGSQFEAVRDYYPKWNSDDRQGSIEEIAAEHRTLYAQLTKYLPLQLQPSSTTPILNNYTTLPFFTKGKLIFPQVLTKEVPHRLILVNATEEAVKRQAEMGSMNEKRAVRAMGAAIIAMMTLHGTVDDGNGRAYLSLIKTFSEESGFNGIYDNDAFINNGKFELEKAQLILLMYDISTAIRFVAGYNLNSHYGYIPRYLYDPQVIVDENFSRDATRKAMRDLCYLIVHRKPSSTAQRPVVHRKPFPTFQKPVV